jgi:hypothetical protein
MRGRPETLDALEKRREIMNPQTLSRLFWQLPALLGIVFLVMPEPAWHFALFGPWPLWLLAAPVAYACLRWRMSAKMVRTRRPLAGAHVLVFPVSAKFAGPAQEGQRHAA